jgi:simple sugar transport system permease protein
MGIVTTLAPTRAVTVTVSRRMTAVGVFAVLGLLEIFGFGLGAHSGDATFGLSFGHSSVQMPDLVVPAGLTSIILGAATLVLAALRATRTLGASARRWTIAGVLVMFIFSFLCWADAGKSFSLVGLMQSTVWRSIPFVLGALAGVLCERSAVINIAIEGEMLLGAFAGVVVASAVGALWLGIISGALAGGLIGVLLAVFAIRYLVNQIILGVVLNVFAAGLTGYLYDRVLIPHMNTLNSAPIAGDIKIPLLGDIPIIGPVLFDGSIFLYLMYLFVFLVHVGLFHTRWGLRIRAVGEHPTAADTVGIKVLFNRYRNVIIAGLIAGIAGAFLTIGSVGSFNKNISSGKGYIALAAMIFGRWSPLGAVGAALLFGFADALQNVLSILDTPIPPEFLLMLPYLATIVAVAGLVGRVRMPKADGQPYVKN